MKKTFLFFAALLSSLVFAEDTWDECPRVEMEAVMTVVDSATNSYTIRFKATNISSNENFGAPTGYCYDAAMIQPMGQVMTGANNECVNYLSPGDSITLDYQFSLDDTVTCVTFQMKLKKALDYDQYCVQEFVFCLDNLSIEEIDLSNIPFKESYYDMLGRQITDRKNGHIYIVRRLYENGYEKTEKKYFISN
jgi:hypothetical protein